MKKQKTANLKGKYELDKIYAQVHSEFIQYSRNYGTSVGETISSYRHIHTTKSHTSLSKSVKFYTIRNSNTKIKRNN